MKGKVQAVAALSLRHIAQLEQTVAELEARNVELEKALRSVNAVAIERGNAFGVCDQIDNDGQPYQSQWLADMLKGGAK